MCVGEPWTCVGQSNDHNSAVIRDTELISGMAKKVDRPGTRETVPDRFRLIPYDFLKYIWMFSETVMTFCEQIIDISKNRSEN